MARPVGARPKTKGPVAAVDFDLVDDQTRVALRKAARDKVNEDRRKQAEDALLAKFMDEERRAWDPDEEMVDIFLDFAPFADRIVLDGVTYFADRQYSVPRRVFNVMQEQIQRSWNHNAEVFGKNQNPYRRPLNLISKNGGAFVSGNA